MKNEDIKNINKDEKENKKINKKEIFIVLAIIVIALLGYIIYRVKFNKDAQYAQVYYQDRLLMEFDVNEDYVYKIQGSYGKMEIEVKDGKWRVTNEECPNHICSSIGWVSVDNYFPIVCLPNEVYIILKD